MDVTPGVSHAVVTTQTAPDRQPRRLPPGVDQLPSGAYRARVLGPDGRQRSLGTFPNATAAGRAASTARAEIQRGQWIDQRRAKITLDAWIAEWMPSRPVRPATLEKDRERYANHIKPYLGDLRLIQLTPFRIQAWMTQLDRDGRNPATVKKAHTLLKTALGVRGAVGDNRLPANPCQSVPAPTVERGQKWTLLTRDQFEQILTHAPGWEPLLLVAAFGGLRWGELAELRRSDFNPLHGTLTISRAVDPKGRVGPPKSGKPRTVTLPQRAVQALDEHTKMLLPDALIFTAPRGGRLSASNFRLRVWTRACTKAGVTARVHDLRHSCASWLLDSGATLAQVRDHLGHSSVTVTELYLHTDQATLGDVVRRAFG